MPSNDTNPFATGKLAGISEIAELRGVTRQRALHFTQEPDFPTPIDVLRATTVWDRQEVVDTSRSVPGSPERAVRIAEGRSTLSCGFARGCIVRTGTRLSVDRKPAGFPSFREPPASRPAVSGRVSSGGGAGLSPGAPGGAALG